MLLMEVIYRRKRDLTLGRYGKLKKILKSNEERLEELNHDLEELKTFLNEFGNREKIRNADTKDITSLLLKYKQLDLDYETLESELRTIKLLLKGIYDRKLSMNLSPEQSKTLTSYFSSLEDLVHELKDRIDTLTADCAEIKEDKAALEEEILELEILLEKLRDPNDLSLLTEEDLAIVRKISDNKKMSAKYRKDALVGFIEYNNDRKMGKPKEYKISLDEVISCFEEFGIDINPIVKRYSSEVERNSYVENIREVLTYMRSVDILDKFELPDLLSICIYGNVDSVRETYEEVSKSEKNDNYYHIASLWVHNMPDRTIVSKKKNKRGKHVEKDEVSLHNVANLISKEEFERNKKLLIENGFQFDENDIGVRKTLTTPSYRLTESLNAAKMYGFVNAKRFKIWMLSEYLLMEKKDTLIEIGLFHGHNGPFEYANYLEKYPAKTHNFSYPVYLLLYNARQKTSAEEYYSIFEGKKKGQLPPDLNDGRLGPILDSEEAMNNFIDSEFVKYDDCIRNYQLYEDRIDSTYNVQIDEEIFGLSEIQSLESNNTVEGNPFVYVFDGVVISRLKVLRHYSLLHDGTLDSLMASIVKGSFLRSESLEKIAHIIGYSMGGNDGILRKVQSQQK